MFRRILVPVDFADVTPRPLGVALELAQLGGGEIKLLTVVDDSFPNPDILSFQLPWADFHRHLREEAQRRLEVLCREVGTGKETEVCVVRGHPARTIVKFAHEEACDLIVMATHGTSGLQHALIGSVTDRVLRQVSCPVLIVRLHGIEEHGRSH